MIKIKYRGIELIRATNENPHIWFVNRPEQVRALGLYAGYTKKRLKELIDKILENQ